MIYGKVDVFHEIMSHWSNETWHKPAETFVQTYTHQLKYIPSNLVKEDWELALGRIHVQGEYALNNNVSVRSTWDWAEIWKR